MRKMSDVLLKALTSHSESLLVVLIALGTRNKRRV
jgi:hypothetical protein